MKRLLGLLFLGVACAGSGVLADGIRPVTLQVKEKEPGRFLVQWRVPKQLPPRAIPSPVLPEVCEGVGEREVTERSGAWFLSQTYRCSGDLAGQAVGIDFPLLNGSVSTLLRVELLSGERYAQILDPGEDPWQVPESRVGKAPPLLRRVGEAVLQGARHFAGNGVHLVFLLSLVLLGRLATALRLATFFTAAQLLAVVLLSVSGLALDPAFGEIGVAVAAVLLAREALRSAGERRQLGALAAAAGLVHGLSLAALAAPAAGPGGAGAGYLALMVLGLDAALLLSLMALSVLGRLVPARLLQAPFPGVAVYLTAGAALALGLAAPLPGSAASAAGPRRSLELPALSQSGGSGTPASRRVAAWTPDAGLQSFVSVDAFEVRHEVLVRLQSVAAEVDLDPSGTVAVEAQEAVRQRVSGLVATRTALSIDGERVGPVDRRVDFLSLDTQGALLRLAPIPEPVEDAWLGVTSIYLTPATPRDVTLIWDRFDLADMVPATVTDPESSRTEELTAGRAELRWDNELSEDPAPVVRSTAVEPTTLWLPLLSLIPLGALAFLGLAAMRGRRRAGSLALARILLALALLLAPTGGVAWALPFSLGSAPDTGQVRRILSGVLPNLYRAFEFPTESAVYDRLALSVTGDTLTEVYLEHRRAMEMEARGGARARVEAVEVVQVDSVEPGEGAAFVTNATWTVGGTVSHFGHRHFRQNRYQARVVVVPVDDVWKIQSVELLDEERLR